MATRQLPSCAKRQPLRLSVMEKDGFGREKDEIQKEFAGYGYTVQIKGLLSPIAMANSADIRAINLF